MTRVFKPEPCPICGTGQWVPRSIGTHIISHKRKKHTVSGLHDAVCDHCGARGFLEGQVAENCTLIENYEKTLKDYISPRDIYRIREKYMLSQKDAEKAFAAGKNMFSKWENGDSVPNGTAALNLIRALEDPSHMQWLADRAGVKIEHAERTLPLPAANTRLYYDWFKQALAQSARLRCHQMEQSFISAPASGSTKQVATVREPAFRIKPIIGHNVWDVLNLANYPSLEALAETHPASDDDEPSDQLIKDSLMATYSCAGQHR